ncbi:hypothetical protein HYH02_002100 [Chlamydomonas schloesseri]|uniref:MYND-type domain-containing protein n=1 Tax=Chlamydomonas schloesseri TaxID=2026947 RepID=A0A836BCL1_9CHLO|nr:hypothetical protein HYH02_002100 [Chlamydomonas schloesseri]|eukprot:KAG2453894.1 hypothetical protein HYH02_002100 [Chlamydomonas schloesseri]
MCLFAASGGGSTTAAAPLPPAQEATATRAAAALLHMRALRWPGALAARALVALEVFAASSPPAAEAVAAAEEASAGSSSRDSSGGALPAAAVAAAHAEMVVRAFINNFMYRACLMTAAISRVADQQQLTPSRGSAGGSSSSSSAACSGGSSTQPRRPPDDLPALLLAEVSSSGFFEQAARLLLRQAAGLGRRRLLQPGLMAHVEGHMPSGYRYVSEAADGGSRSQVSDMGHVFLTNLCKSAVELHSQRRRHCIHRHGGGLTAAAIRALGGDGASGSSSSGGSGSSSSRAAAASGPPPPLWGDCMHTLMLAEVVAGLAAAGYGGGVRGTWGLPPELVAGLPVLGLDSRGMNFELGPLMKQLSHQQHQKIGGTGSSARGAARVLALNDEPFHMFAAVLNQQLLVSELPGVGADAAALEATRVLFGPYEAAVQGTRLLAARRGSSRSGSGAAAARIDRRQQQQQQQQPQPPPPCWRLPVGRRALATLCLRIADLAAAGHGAYGGGASSPAVVTARDGGSSSGSSSPRVLIRFRPHQLWRVGTNAIHNARRLLLLPAGIDGRRLAGGGAAAAVSGADAGMRAVGTPPPAGPEGGWAGGGGGDGTVGFPQLPAAWWRSLAALLHVPVPLRVALVDDDEPGSWVYHNDGSVSLASRNAGDPAVEGREAAAVTRQPHALLTDAMRLQGMPDMLLPPQPPPGLAAALQAGLVPAFEAALRRADGTEAAARLTAALLQPEWLAAEPGASDGLGCSWPLLQQLLAFAPPAQTAALITSLGKRLQLALDQAEAAAPAATASGSSSGGALTTPVLLLTRQLAAALPLMALVDLDVDAPGADGVGCFVANAEELESRAVRAMACPAMARAEELLNARRRQEAARTPAAVARRQQWAQVRLLLSHALHRWLPALARFARRLPGAELSRLMRMGTREVDEVSGFTDMHVACACVSKALVWIQPPLIELAAAEAAVAARMQALATARAAGCSSSSSPVAEREADLAAATAELASWRQLLLKEVDVVALLETGIRVVMQLLRSPTAHIPVPSLAAITGGAGAVEANVPAAFHLIPLLLPALNTVSQAVPGALAEVLLLAPTRDGANGGGEGSPASAWPWSPAVLTQLFQAAWGPSRELGVFSAEDAGGMAAHVHGSVEGLRRFAKAHGAAAAAAGFDGGPAARHARIASEGVPGLDIWTPVSPLAARLAGPAAAAAAASGVAGGSGSSSAGRPAEPQPLSPLRCCANPRCTNLAAAVGADSDADLTLLGCSGCRGAVAYCSRGCQAAHWRAGHKEACRVLRDR